MDDIIRPRARGVLSTFRIAAGALLAALALVAVRPASAGNDAAPVSARAGLDLARDAALSWAPDAYLTYLENDEDLDAAGQSTRWGYLYHSPSLDRSRVYSVRDGRILVAENLDMKFDAPPLPAEWVDSARAVEAAEAGPGRKFREKFHGAIATMLLVRGAFQEGDPDETAWTIVYTAPGVPSLFVMVDADGAKVRRTWRG